jgi:hypothetical protein
LNSESETNGNSKSENLGTVNEYSNTKTVAQDLSKTESLAKTIDKTSSNSNTVEVSDTVSINMQVPFTGGFQVICAHQLNSMQIPFVCIDPTTGEREMFYTDYAIVEDPTNVNKNCFITITSSKDSRKFYRIDDIDFANGIGNNIQSNSDFEGVNAGNTLLSESFLYRLRSDSIRDKSAKDTVVLKTMGEQKGKFKLILYKKGNIMIKDSTGFIYWETRTDLPFVDGSEPRLRLTINTQGHILLQSEGLFQGYQPFKQLDKENNITTYATIWSNLPKHLPYPIGTNRNRYKLMLLETINSPDGVDLVLYDGGGSLIWCARNILCSGPHEKGYRFPVDYGYPTTIVTDNGFVNKKDPHMYFDKTKYKLKVGVEFQSETSGSCDPILKSGEYLSSLNGRFAMILEKSGNLIFKDGQRTMWESYSSGLSFHIAPYTLRLSVQGLLYIVDSHSTLVWSTVSGFENEVASTFKLTDDGDIQVSTSWGIIWNQLQPNDQFLKKMTYVFNERRLFWDSKCIQPMAEFPNPLTIISSIGNPYSPLVSSFNSAVCYN